MQANLSAVSALLSIAGLVINVSVHAGDEQWDDRFGSLPPNTGYGNGYGSLVLYRGEVYGDKRKWDGTNFSDWPGVPLTVKAVSGTDLFIGGGTATYSLPSDGVDRWDGTNWNAVGNGVGVSDYGTYVLALTTSGNDLYVGGHFDFPGGGEAAVARWDGTNWYDLGLSDPADPDVPGIVYTFAVKDGTIYAGGSIAVTNWVAAGVVKREGTNWSVLASGINFARNMVFRGNDLFVANGGGGLLKWGGTNWTSVGGVNGRIYELSVHGDDIFVGGNFTVAGGVPAANIAKWDGTTWSALGSGLTGGYAIGPSQPSNVYGLAVWGQDVIVSGNFTNAGGKPSVNFAIWHDLPALKYSHGNGSIQLSWPAAFTNYVLECNESLSTTNWADVSPPPATNQYAAPVSGTNKFFRLKRL